MSQVSRNKANQEKRDIKFPNIFLIKNVNIEKTLVDGKRIIPQVVIKEKPNLDDKKSGEEDLSDSSESSEDSSEQLVFPRVLDVSAKYNFNEEILVFRISDSCFQWSLVSLDVIYSFNNKKLEGTDFVEIPLTDIAYFRSSSSDPQRTRIFKVNIKKLDRHVLKQRFSLNVKFIFLGDLDIKLCESEYSFHIPPFQRITQLKFKALGHYDVGPCITKLYNYNFKEHDDLDSDEMQLLRVINSKRISRHSTLDVALDIEDLTCQEEFKHFSISNVKLDIDNTFCYFDVKKKKLPEQIEEMSICLVPMHKYREGHINNKDDCFFTSIDVIRGEKQKKKDHFKGHYKNHKGKGIPETISFRKPDQTFSIKPKIALNSKTEYFVRFIPNRINFRACNQALVSILSHLLHQFIGNFEEKPVYCYRENKNEVKTFQWYNDQIGKNEEQMSAIKNIVNCTAYPFPYVVHGPPGTGKTCCIVESILQILKANPNSRIMVTSQSNSACDEIGVRLLKYMSRNDIFRFYSPSLLNPGNGETSKILRETSNICTRSNKFPSMEEFMSFKVIISTLITCSRFIQIENVEMNNYFDYVFVDECAAATEPEALVPIIGFGADRMKITTNIVLLGDHKQLGPVINSDVAAGMGLGVSLMERIMSKRRYSMDPVTKTFDNNFVTLLLDNFRSHPAILQFSNVLFYESKLRAKVEEPERSFGTFWSCLENKQFPILFHCNKTPSSIIKGGTSSFNTGEADRVKFFVDLLLTVGINGEKIKQEDIGIVSPYKAQLNLLRTTLNHAKGVEIGTAEYYQGREKKIIISTVKSHDTVGFLKSEKRLNVCITRAKSLLIVVGNADTLQKNSLWNSFLHFCKANDGVCGEPFLLEKLTEEERKVLDELNSIFDQLSLNDEADTEPAIERKEELRKIKERMLQVQKLVIPFH